ncbi:MAG: hypothetical protein GXX95_10275 [Methanomassiliicoccus sp.]|nr:hypothetical protein [Methanomassiliicoccus sp.]
MGSAEPWLVSSSSVQYRQVAGTKARGLADLNRLGFNVPATWALTYRAHEVYKADREAALRRLREELKDLDSGYWAVRSSADVEDRQESSYAGLFTSTLGVRGLDDLVRAIEATWASAESPRVSIYSQRGGDGGLNVKMGVLVQQMVDSVLSGVSFSRDPVTGRKKAVIEAVKGSGEPLVQQGQDPLNLYGGEVPADLIDEIRKGTGRIADRLKMDVDIEWAYDGERLWWLQVRPVTTRSSVNIYSNRMSKEMLPGAIHPLVWSVNIPLLNGAWIKIFRQLSGRKDLEPFTLSRMFYYRVYFNMGEIGKIWESLGLPPDSLERLTLEGMGNGMKMRMTPQALARLPSIAWFAIGKLGWPGKTERFISSHERTCHTMMADDLTTMSDETLLDRYEVLMRINQEAAYRNIITMVLSAMFTGLLKRSMERGGVSLEEVEWNKLQQEQMSYYPNSSLRSLRDKYMEMPPSLREVFEEKGAAGLAGMEGSERFLQEWDLFMVRFGHISESGNDFTRPSWREQPLDIMLMDHNTTNGRRRLERRKLSDIDASPMSRLFISGMASRASRYSLLKERMSSSYALGYGMFRPLFLELGTRIRDRGSIDSREDVFFLYLDELRSALREGGKDLHSIVAFRKEEMERSANIALPEVIYGEEAPPPISPEARVLKGLATSKGYYRGRIKVVRDASDFGSVSDGDVVVIPFSDVSWSSIIAKASAVVSESGGVLSHCSILAREYGIPSVVSVPHAMSLQNGATVIVDGFKGLVYLDPEAVDP